MVNLYNADLSPVVTVEDLYELYGFKTTSYLQKTCALNGVTFKLKPIKTEDAKLKPNAKSQQEISITVILISVLTSQSQNVLNLLLFITNCNCNW